MANLTCGVYRCFNRKNGKVYIGSSNGVEKRIGGHICQLDAGRHANPHFSAAWRLHGRESFEWRLMRECSEGELIEVEQEYMDLYMSWDGDCGYNIADKAGRPPGRKGHKKSAETRRKMAEAAKKRFEDPERRRMMSERLRGENNPMYGKKHSPEMIEVYRQKSTGRKHSPETLEKMRAWNTGRKMAPLTESQKDEKSEISRMLSDEQVELIRGMRKAGGLWKHIAKYFGCSPSCVRRASEGGRRAYRIRGE